jgi:hypothetical protein
MNPENAEDVSFGFVPGSVGSAGPVVVPWAPRATPASDRARAEAMEALRPMLDKYRAPATSRTPVRLERYAEARERVLKGRGW